eukprot:m.44803 g.44803  ORF g.44803 m.44803 type:complete len:574 (-) comp10953_c0_seq1:25-1746(-)
MDAGDQDSACDVGSERDHEHSQTLLFNSSSELHRRNKDTSEEHDEEEEEEEGEEPLPKHPWTIAMVILFANFTYYASFAVLNAVLTDIAHDFQTTESAAMWVTTLPPLLGAALTPSCGSLSDRLGRKRVWVVGYILNFLALGVAGVSNTLGVLLFARVMCGVGSAMENPTGMALILAAFPETRHGLIIGLAATVGTVANSVGLLVGGIVTEYYGWRVLFLGPFIPVGLALFVAVWVLPPDNRTRARARRGGPGLRDFDWTGSVLFSLVMTLLLVGINRGGANSFTDPFVIITLVAAVALTPVLVRVERRATHAILPPALIGEARVAATMAYSLVRDTTYMILFIIFPLYLRDLCGVSATTVSLLTFVRPLASGIMGPLAGRLADHPRFPAHLIMLWSAYAAISDKVLGLLAMWSGSVTPSLILPFQSLLGGVAGANGTASRLFITARTTKEHLGNVQGIISMLMFVGNTVGIDIGIAFLAASRDTRGVALLEGFRAACITALVCYTLSLALPTWLSLHSRGSAPKAAIPPLHARRHIALHSMVLGVPAIAPDTIALLAGPPSHPREIQSSEML